MSDLSRAIVPMGDLSSLVGATPGASTNWFGTALTVPPQCFRITITVAVSTASIVKYQRNSNALIALGGGTTAGGTALTGGCAFTFTVGCRPGDTFQMQDSAGATPQELQIEGNHGGV